MQISNRSSKQASRDGEDYTALFTRVASILVAAVPLVAPTDTPLSHLLESDEAADGACRMCSALSDFVTCGHLQAVPREPQLQVLLQLAGYLGSSYLPLASLTFAAWRRLVQGHERCVNKSPGECYCRWFCRILLGDCQQAMALAGCLCDATPLYCLGVSALLRSCIPSPARFNTVLRR